jgi:tetratricopeptide (TPR) repeat protein
MFAYFAAGQLREGLEYVNESNRRLFGKEKLGFEEIGPENFIGRAFRAMMITSMGQLEEGASDMERAIRIARDQGKSFSWMRASMVDLALFSGGSEAALNHARAAVESAESYGSPFFTATTYRALGLAHILAEEWAEARRALEHGLELIRSSRTALHVEGAILGSLGRALLGEGHGERARDTAHEAVSAAQKSHARLAECYARLTLARILIETEGPAGATAVEAQLQKLEELIEVTGASSYQPFAHLERAELARLLGDEATRRRELRASRAGGAGSPAGR